MPGKILKIPRAYYSRIANLHVREQARVRPLSADLLDRQIKLHNRIVDSLEDNLLRRPVCEQGGAEPKKVASSS